MNVITEIINFFSDLTFEKIIQFLVAPPFFDNGWLMIIRSLFIGFSLLFLVFIIFVLLKTTWLKRLIIWDWKEFLTYRPFVLDKIGGKWRKINLRLENDLESEWKLAVIEADEMLDKILVRMGFKEGELEEKLGKLTLLSNIDDIKKAHKIRNNIVHDPNYKLTLAEAREVISIYEKALEELNAL